MYFLYKHHHKIEDLRPISDFIEKELNCKPCNTENTEAIIILGGDGTILRCVNMFKGNVPPIYAFNFGSYGFLAPFECEEVQSVVKKIKKKEKFFELKRRRLKINETTNALNDLLITRRNHGVLNHFSIKINGCFVENIRCDSVLISSASGSSAYNYSVGGPVIAANCDAFVLNCVNPCQTFFRSVVLGADSVVTIKALDNLHDNSESFCVVDGHFEIKAVEFTIECEKKDVVFLSPINENELFGRKLSKINNLR